VLFAEWSGETAIENQDDVVLAAKIGKPHGFIVEIIQRKIRRRCVQQNFWHFLARVNLDYWIVGVMEFWIN
jgi:hypothetical protein